MGDWSLRNLERGGYTGKIYPVNPGYRDLRGMPCYPSLDGLPETPDLVMFAIGDRHLEQSLDEAIARSVPAAVIMSSLYLDNDATPPLKERLQKKILDSGLLVCGANGMGFYNVRDNTWCCGFDSGFHAAPGNASLISHSGSGMSGIIDCEERLRINFAVSSGSELSVSMDQYLDFVLDLPETKVVGLFVETARNPQGFQAALAKAAEKQIPLVALKVGKTKKAVELSVSHSGALAGDDATYDALFHAYGVHRVNDMDELATAMILFAELNPIGPGGLVTLHDSGGERQLLADLAAEAGVPLTDLTAATVARLERVLEPELPAVNPLDAWSRGGATAREIMTECLSVMLQDPGAAIGGLMHDRAPGGDIYQSYVSYMERAQAAAGKPVALVAARQGTGSDPLVAEVTHRGLPVLDGVMPFLRGVRGLMNYRDFLADRSTDVPPVSRDAVSKWTDILSAKAALDEATSLQMLRDFGFVASDCAVISSSDELLAAASRMSYPLVLKTAMPGILHKSECRGVQLNIVDQQELLRIYEDFRTRIGAVALVTEMAKEGVEMILGARRDPQFGPIVTLGFGGVLAEVLRNVTFLLPPFDAEYALRRIRELPLYPLLHGVRGRPPAATAEFCRTAAKFSVMVTALGAQLQEIDINPVIVTEDNCVAVDALVVGSAVIGDN
jgi:acyl-CoA synthetase (NDP forming)